MTTTAALRVWAAVLVGAVVAIMVVAVGVEPASAAFPGGNGAIAFQCDINGVDQVCRMNSDGSGEVLLSNTSGANGDPAWSSDGKKIVFTNTSTSGQDDIYWMTPGGWNEKNLTNHSANDRHPAFSPNNPRCFSCKTIVFASDRHGGDYDIFKMTVDGNGKVTAGPLRMTSSTRDDIQPVVSPGGKKIAFVSWRFKNSYGTYRPSILVMNANGPESARNKPVFLIWRPPGNVYLDWSPDGKKLAFNTYLCNSFSECIPDEIFVMKAEPKSSTNEPVRLTENNVADYAPVFSPDGSKIAFVSTDGQISDIFVMNANGSGAVNLTEGESRDESLPSWQPVP